jgi:phenylacetate-CoA ligase
MIYRLIKKLHGSGMVAARLPAQQRIPWLPEKKLAALRDSNLRSIIRYAAKTVPYYRDMFDREGIDPGSIRTVTDLDRLPLLEKEAVRKDPYRFVSTARDGQNAVSFTSSGTTGEPLKIWHDQGSMLANMAYGQRERKAISQVLGEEARMKTLSIIYRGNMVDAVREYCRQWAFVPRGPDRHTLSVASPLEETISKINDFQPDVIVSYGSFLEVLFRKLEHREISMHLPRVILYGGDGMTIEARKMIEEKFGVPVFSSYQCVESFKIGFFCEHRRGFHLHSDLCHVKIIDSNGKNLPNGTKGEVVISNLVNRGSVLLNYRLGDIGTISEDPCSCGRTFPLLSELEGRVEDIIQLDDGGFVHPRAVWGVIKRNTGVLQYQLIQHERQQFELRLVTADRTAYQEIMPQITRQLKGLLGPSANIEPGYHEHLSREKSGKFRPVISLRGDRRKK